MPDLDELKAVATGGTEGRAAYKEGREAVQSDQRSAIDAALGAATQRNAGGPALAALDAIIRPTGDAAAARLTAGGAQFGSSMDALSGALGTFQQGATAAEGMAYDMAHQEAARLAAERAAREAEIQAAKDQAEARRRAADAERAEKARLAELELMAPLLGAQYQEDARRDALTGARTQTKEELRQIGTKALRNLTDPKERDAAMTELLTAETAEEALEVISRYAPDALPAEPVDMVPGPNPGANPRAARPRTDTGMDPGIYADLLGEGSGIEELYGTTIPALNAPVREIETSPWDFAQQAYMDLGGDPFRAYDLFSPNPRGGLNDRSAQEDHDFYIQTGMTPAEYEQTLRDQETFGEDEYDSLLTDIANGVGVAPSTLSATAKEFGFAEVEAAEVLATPDASAIITDKVGQAIAALGEGTDPELVAQAMIEAMREDLAGSAQIDPGYANMIIALALEQFEAHAATYGGL